jgi:hypothetical protein
MSALSILTARCVGCAWQWLGSRCIGGPFPLRQPRMPDAIKAGSFDLRPLAILSLQIECSGRN